MAQAPNTQSTLTRPNGANATSTAISPNILIMVGNTPVGAVQSFSVSESREIRTVSEIGSDGIIDSVPSASAQFSIDCTRIRFDKLRIAEAFSRGFIHIQSQVYPFDIVVLDKQKLDVGSQITTVIKNCWFKSISYDYVATGDWVISDKCSFTAETIYSTLSGTTNANVATGGQRGILFSNIPTERLVDIGSNGRRGSLDSAGLIDLGTSAFTPPGTNIF